MSVGRVPTVLTINTIITHTIANIYLGSLNGTHRGSGMEIAVSPARSQLIKVSWDGMLVKIQCNQLEQG